MVNCSIDSSVGVDKSVMLLPTSTFWTPSTSQLTPFLRAPLIDTLMVLDRPKPVSSARSLETPGASSVSLAKLRLLIGSSCTCRESISFCTAVVACGRICPVTSTTSDTPPVARLASTRSRSFTASVTPRTVRVWKPGSVNVISYRPIGRPETK